MDLSSIQAALADRYSVERELGVGGMAVVYLAEDPKHNRLVAVKVLQPEVAAAFGAERFLREVEISAKLQHPHILGLIDSGEADGYLYYVMPYVEGESLRDLIARKKQLAFEEAVQIAREVADGLAYAHSYGVIHRDIKPENILLSGGHAVIADFGIARAAMDAGGEQLTQTGVVLGTPWYMSPEQAAGDPGIDGRGDIYALGCVLYEMVTGAPPFTGPTPQAVLARHSVDAAPSIRTVRQSLPVVLEIAIEKALAKVPADRFETAALFAEALASRDVLTQTTPAMRTSAPSTARRWPWYRLSYVAVVLLALAAGYLAFRGWRTGVVSGERIRLVVLPFQNFSTPDEEYFADGITEEITGKLSAVSQLGVIARTSAMQYKNTTKPVSEIGSELDVDYIIEGSVRWMRRAQDSQEIRVSVRLIDVSDGTQAWSYEDNMPLADIFAMQMSIAEQIGDALDVVLLQPERQRLAATPTEDLEAYDYYLRGNSYYNRSWEREDVELSLEMYGRAAELDPTYSLALAQVGKTNVWIYRLGYDPTEARLEAARVAIDSALSLDPELPEAHIALGLYHYWGHWEYEAAIGELSIARNLQPGNAWVFLQIGNIRRRQGQWAEAVRNYERAGDLDPRFHVIWLNIGHIYSNQREFTQAERYLDRAISLSPTFLDARILKAMLAIHRDRDPEGALHELEAAAEQISPSRWRPMWGNWLFGLSRIVHGMTPQAFQHIVPGEYGLDSASYFLAKAEIHERIGEAENARAHYDSALTTLSATLAEQSDQAWLQGELAVVYAGLGRSEEALGAGRRATELMSISRDAFEGPDWVINLARVYMQIGDPVGALDNLELALAIPSRISTNWLSLDPLWDPLREDPRFQNLLQTEQPR